MIFLLGPITMTICSLSAQITSNARQITQWVLFALILLSSQDGVYAAPQRPFSINYTGTMFSLVAQRYPSSKPRDLSTRADNATPIGERRPPQTHCTSRHANSPNTPPLCRPQHQHQSHVPMPSSAGTTMKCYQ